MAHQTWFWSKRAAAGWSARCPSRSGSGPRPGPGDGAAARVRAAGPSRCCGEGGDPQPVGVSDPQLRAGMRTFLAGDHPHPRWPAGQLQQPGQFRDPGALGGWCRARRRRASTPRRGSESAAPGCWPAGRSRSSRTPLPVQPVQEGVAGPGPVGTDQDPATGPAAGPVPGQLGQRLAGHGDVVGFGVRPGVPRPQHHRQRLPDALGPVVEEGAQRVVPEPALERRRRLLPLRMRGDQGCLLYTSPSPRDRS